jgi:hypothetical protein
LGKSRFGYGSALGEGISRDPLASSPPYLGLNLSGLRPHMQIGELAVGPNLYEYVDNNPVDRIDPTGRNTIVLGGEIGGEIGGPPGVIIGAGIGALAGAGIYVCVKHNDDVKKCRERCNEDFEAEYSVCGQLPEPYRSKCEQDAFSDLDHCLRGCGGMWF